MGNFDSLFSVGMSVSALEFSLVDAYKLQSANYVPFISSFSGYLHTQKMNKTQKV